MSDSLNRALRRRLAEVFHDRDRWSVGHDIVSEDCRMCDRMVWAVADVVVLSKVRSSLQIYRHVPCGGAQSFEVSHVSRKWCTTCRRPADNSEWVELYEVGR